MLHLIPAPLHRLALRVAYAVRRRYRRIAKPHLFGIAVILRDETGRLLLVRHTYGPQSWALPAGGIGRREDPEAGARREMREELGCELGDMELLRRFDETLGTSPHTGWVFSARPLSPPAPDLREIAAIGWFAADDLPAVKLTRVTARRLRELGLLQ